MGLRVTGAITSYYTPGLAYSKGTEKGRYLGNALGSTLAIDNPAGTMRSRYSYDAYGITSTHFQNQSSPYLFAGKHGYYADGETGMELLGHRYYLPKLGRFLTQDPLGHEAGLNLYQYCGNSPLSTVDPDGLEVRPLNVREIARFHTALSYLDSQGSQSVADTYRQHLGRKGARFSFMVDTEVGGAVWKHDVLYLGPTLFDETPWDKATGKTRASLQMIDLEQKAWFASILLHEHTHITHNETWSVYRWNVTKVERRAWDSQIRWLQGVQRGYRTTDVNRALRIDYVIDRARDGRRQYD